MCCEVGSTIRATAAVKKDRVRLAQIPQQAVCAMRWSLQVERGFELDPVREHTKREEAVLSLSMMLLYAFVSRCPHLSIHLGPPIA